MSRATPFLRWTGPVLSVILLGLPSPVLGLQAHPNSAPDSLRRIQSVEPLTGPPGTRVEIFTENLPLQARIHVGVGSIGTGFEVLGEGVQGEWGEVSAAVAIPSSATWDKPIALIFLNAIFSPIAISRPFHVTDERGVIRRSGSLMEGGDSCVPFRDLDGFDYALRGNLGSARAGDPLEFEGRVASADPCPSEATTVNVTRVIRTPTPDRQP